jgi:hypothetical protein
MNIGFYEILCFTTLLDNPLYPAHKMGPKVGPEVNEDGQANALQTKRH